jgi:hypothetical protein
MPPREKGEKSEPLKTFFFFNDRTTNRTAHKRRRTDLRCSGAIREPETIGNALQGVMPVP